MRQARLTVPNVRIRDDRYKAVKFKVTIFGYRFIGGLCLIRR